VCAVPKKKPATRPKAQPRETVHFVDLRSTDTSELLPAADRLLENVEAYQRYAAHAKECPESAQQRFGDAWQALEDFRDKLAQHGLLRDEPFSGPAEKVKALALLCRGARSLLDMERAADKAPAGMVQHHWNMGQKSYGFFFRPGDVFTFNEAALANIQLGVKRLRGNATGQRSDNSTRRNQKPCILWYGENPQDPSHRQYGIGDCEPITLTESEHMVLYAFLAEPPLPAMDQGELRRRSVEHAPRVLKKLRTKYGGRFAPAIAQPPGKKASGGFSVRIRQAGYTRRR
jgi:hypothetical protein